MWWDRVKAALQPSPGEIRPDNYTDSFKKKLGERWSKSNLKLYLIAAAPKSGSTWCAEFLASYLDCPSIFAGKVPGRVEQDLDDAWLSRLRAGQTAIIHQHCRYHQVTEAYIEALSIKPLALMRNAFDSVPSIRDHLRAEKGNWPFGYVDPTILDQTDEAIDLFVAHHIMPWYFNFAVGWVNSPFPVMTYEQIFSDKKAGAATLLRRLEIEVDQEKLDRVIAQLDGGRTRLNIGVTGRGQSLSEGAKTHLSLLASHYSHHDLQPLGFSGNKVA